MQRAYPSLVPDFDSLVGVLPRQQRQLLLQQQQQEQQPAQKRRKVSSGGTAGVEPSDAANLLLALRCLLRWEDRQHQEQEKQLLLQLLLFGGPAPEVEGVVECIDLVSDEEDESTGS